MLYLVFKSIPYLIRYGWYSVPNANSKDFFSDAITFENQITFMVNDFLFCASIIISGFSERNLEMNTMLFLVLLFHFYHLLKKKIIDWKAETSKEKVQNQLKQIKYEPLFKVNVSLWKVFGWVKYNWHFYKNVLEISSAWILKLITIKIISTYKNNCPI